MVVNSHETAVELAKQKIDLLNYIEHATGVKAKRRFGNHMFLTLALSAAERIISSLCLKRIFTTPFLVAEIGKLSLISS